jgi:hypothetical protein
MLRSLKPRMRVQIPLRAPNLEYEVKAVAYLPYNEVHFVFVNSHWDHHLGGLCRYEGKLCRFSTIEKENPNYDPVKDETDPEYNEWMYNLFCIIYELSPWEKLKALYQKRMFELMVGYHWTYPDRKSFGSRKPKWLYNFLFHLYYKKWFKKIVLLELFK